jgi:hypothetical protein
MEINIESLINLTGIHITNMEISEKQAYIYCQSDDDTNICPKCHAITSTVRMYKKRTIKDLALLGRSVYLILSSRQFQCKNCKSFFNERFSFVEPSKTMTTLRPWPMLRYEEYVYKMTQKATLSYVANFENLDPKTVSTIFQTYSLKELDQKKSSMKIPGRT